MESNMKSAGFELGVVIVDFGMGSKISKVARQHGVQHCIVFLGSGTLNNRVLEFLRLADIRKEIVLMVADRCSIESAMDAINERFRLDKPFHGIAYTKSLRSLVGFGVMNVNCQNQYVRRDVMYQSIMIIVDRGRAEQVMEIAVKAGARGGTIMKARSAANEYDSSTLFNVSIEPEKEVIIILAETTTAETISDAINRAFATEDGWNGVILCQDVNKTYGIK